MHGQVTHETGADGLRIVRRVFAAFAVFAAIAYGVIAITAEDDTTGPADDSNEPGDPPDPGDPADLATPRLVADPRPGDLRTQSEADTLPADYLPAPPAESRLDVAYGPFEGQRLDLHLPAIADAPVVVFLHAGGWASGDKSDVPAMVMRFVERGYAVASVEYALSDQDAFPAPVHDVNHAIRWLKVHGAETGEIDGGRIVLYGISAGGHLAAFAATTEGRFVPDGLSDAEAAVDSRVAGAVVVVGPTDLGALEADGELLRDLVHAFVGCDPCEPQMFEAASPGTYVHEGVPPAYWAYGVEDQLVDPATHGAPIAQAWAAAAGAERSWYDLVEDGGHNLDPTLVNQRAIEEFVDLAIAS